MRLDEVFSISEKKNNEGLDTDDPRIQGLLGWAVDDEYITFDTFSPGTGVTKFAFSKKHWREVKAGVEGANVLWDTMNNKGVTPVSPAAKAIVTQLSKTLPDALTHIAQIEPRKDIPHEKIDQIFSNLGTGAKPHAGADAIHYHGTPNQAYAGRKVSLTNSKKNDGSSICEGDDHWKDQIKGGLADKKKPSDFDQKELELGIKDELEHTDDPKKAAEIAMDHLTKDKSYYSKPKDESAGDEMDEVYAMMAEAEDFIDYPQGERHPFLQQKRDELKKTVDYLTAALDKNGTPQMKRISQELKGIENIPADQISAKLANAHQLLHKAKRDLASLPSADKKADAQAIGDALLAMPSAFKIASAITSGDKSDKGLWNTKMSGYVDDKTGQFVRKGTTVYPAGTDKPPSAAARKAADAQASQSAAVGQRIKPMIRPQGNDPFAKKSEPVKPTTPQSVLNRIKPLVRKKEEGIEESAWFDAMLVLEGLDEADPKLDYKKSFNKAKKVLAKHGNDLPAGAAGDIHVNKAAKKPASPAPIRRQKAAEGDPLKTASNAEFFETEAGNYFVYRGFNKKYYAMYVSADIKRVRNLGEFADRENAVNAVLEHHDKAAAGLGESNEE